MTYKEDDPNQKKKKKKKKCLNTVHKAEVNNEKTFKVPPGYQCVVMRGIVHLLVKLDYSLWMAHHPKPIRLCWLGFGNQL